MAVVELASTGHSSDEDKSLIMRDALKAHLSSQLIRCRRMLVRMSSGAHAGAVSLEFS